MIVRVVVPGQPVAKGRPRFVRATGRTYTPEKTQRYEDTVRLFASQAMAGAEPLEGALAVRMDFFLAVPSSWSKKRRAAAFAEDYVPTRRPDLDNCIKAVKDAFNGIVWKDDSQVVALRAEKRYAETPRAELRVQQLAAMAAP